MVDIKELKALAEKATKGPWRVVNEIDPNPIFLETWGPDYKTMWWVQRGGENDPPHTSTLENVTPKQTFLKKETAQYLAACYPERIIELCTELEALRSNHERMRKVAKAYLETENELWLGLRMLNEY